MKNRITIGKHKNSTVQLDLDKTKCRHITIVGVTGSGKTLFMLGVMISSAENGCASLVIDMHNILAPDQVHPLLKDRFDLLVNEIDVYEHGISLPLFSPIKFKDGTSERPFDTASAITDCLCRTYRFGDRQRATLRHACQTVMESGFYEHDGISAVGHVLNATESPVAEGLYERLLPLFEHNVFRHGALPLVPGKINIVRVSKFDANTQTVIVNVLLSFLWRMALTESFKEQGVSIFIDEAQNLGFGKDSAITKILQEGRKFNINLTAAMQHLPTSEEACRSLLQSAFVAFFKPTDDSIAKTANIINKTDSGNLRYVLKTLKRGEYVASGDFQETGALEMDGVPIKTPIKITNDLAVFTPKSKQHRKEVAANGIILDDFQLSERPL